MKLPDKQGREATPLLKKGGKEQPYEGEGQLLLLLRN